MSLHWRRHVYLLYFLIVGSLVRRGTATPYTVLVNKAPKCWNVEVPSDTSITVQYDAPDMIIMEETDPDSFKKDEPPTRREEDGLDARYNHHLHQRLDLLKRANIKDITLTITPRDAMGVVIVPRTLPKHVTAERVPSRHREPFAQRNGSFVYPTGALEGGYIEVCIQSYTASPDSPSRVAWTVVLPNEEKEIERQLQIDQQQYLEQLNVENKLISAETSRITTELVRLHRRAQALADDSQYSKPQEESFRAVSVQLHRAVHYWPMIRIVVLLIGGYMQVTHVVNYMKSRHIY